MMHRRNKTLIAKLERLGYADHTSDEYRHQYQLWFDKGTARVWFQDTEADHVTVMRMDRSGFTSTSGGVPEWKVTLEDAPVGLVEETIIHAEGGK